MIYTVTIMMYIIIGLITGVISLKISDDIPFLLFFGIMIIWPLMWVIFMIFSAINQLTILLKDS